MREERRSRLLHLLKESRRKLTSKPSSEKSLRDWFKRKGPDGSSSGWVDCNTCRKNKDGKVKCKACGRKKGEERSKYPSCRPTPAACKKDKKTKGKSWGKKSKAASLPFFEKIIDKNVSLRKFAFDTNKDELVWHRDKEDRIVKVVSSGGWSMQLDDELPFVLKNGDELYIKKNSWHRVLGGSEDLFVKIIKKADSEDENEASAESLDSIEIEGEDSYRDEPNSWDSYMQQYYENIHSMISTKSNSEYENFFASLHSKEAIYHLSNIGNDSILPLSEEWDDIVVFNKKPESNYFILTDYLFDKIFPINNPNCYSLMISALDGLEFSGFKDYINIFDYGYNNSIRDQVERAVYDTCYQYLSDRLPELSNMARKSVDDTYRDSHTVEEWIAFGDDSFITLATRFVLRNAIPLEKISLEDFFGYVKDKNLEHYFVMFANSTMGSYDLKWWQPEKEIKKKFDNKYNAINNSNSEGHSPAKENLVSDINWSRNRSLIDVVEGIILSISKLRDQTIRSRRSVGIKTPGYETFDL